jgi:hypothetical protein
MLEAVSTAKILRRGKNAAFYHCACAAPQRLANRPGLECRVIGDRTVEMIALQQIDADITRLGSALLSRITRKLPSGHPKSPDQQAQGP